VDGTRLDVGTERRDDRREGIEGEGVRVSGGRWCLNRSGVELG
jgi:hypothetical protein